MASATVVSDHSVPSEEVEKQAQSDMNTTESKSVSSLNESVESSKPEELACPPAPSAESEAMIDEKKIEPTPLIEHVKDDLKEDEKPKAEALVELSEKIDNESPEADPTEKVEVKVHICSDEEKFTGSPEQVKPENPTSKVEEKEPSEETIEVKGKVVNPAKFEAETEAEERIVVTEELVRCEEKTSDEAKTSDPLPELEEKATTRDTISVAEDAKIESDKKVCKEPEKIEAAAEKIKETVQATEDKLQDKKQRADEKIEEYKEATKVDEPPEIGVSKMECTKEIEDTKKSQNDPVKTQKQSIVKIAKQSLVKAKKAIIGKSQNSKSPASEPKDDGNK